MKMDRPQIIGLFRQAHDEVIRLRRQIEALKPKAHAYDTIAAISRMPTELGEDGYGVDVAWALKVQIDALIEERAAEVAEGALSADNGGATN
jgi:hypothetical protein